MPIGHIIEEKRPEAEALQNRLIQEWKNPNPNADEPILIAQPNPRKAGNIYLYVIWQEWERLDPSERAEVIMDAYAATHSKSAVLKVTGVRGLTRDEAENRRIRYKTETAA